MSESTLTSSASKKIVPVMPLAVTYASKPPKRPGKTYTVRVSLS